MHSHATRIVPNLLQQIDIVSVIAARVSLKKAGNNFLGLCPFHNENTPSFIVSNQKQCFHCFGCGAHGSVITFLMQYEHLSYAEAMRHLNHQTGSLLHSSRPLGKNFGQYQQQKKIAPTPNVSVEETHTVITKVNQFYQQQLACSASAQEYLAARGVDHDTAMRFQIGYAPSGYHLIKALNCGKQEIAVLTAIGLLAQKDSRVYEHFRDRITFPICNTQGQILGFGARALTPGKPKYLNSPENILFSKGKEVYGLFEAQEAIRQSKKILVVEGYFDVLSLARFGFKNTVASLGTACTSAQITKLLQQAEHLVFAFDGDLAGRKASENVFKLSLPLLKDSSRIEFLFLPQEHDPDSYLRTYGAAPFAQLQQQTLSLASFFCEILQQNPNQSQNFNTKAERTQAALRAQPLLHSMQQAKNLRTQLLHDLAQKLNIGTKEMRKICDLPEEKTFAPLYGHAKTLPTNLAHRILSLLCHLPELATELNEQEKEWLKECLPSHEHKLCLTVLEEYLALNRDTSLAEYFAKSEHAAILSNFPFSLVPEKIDIAAGRQELAIAFQKLKIMKYKQEQNHLIAQIATGNVTDDQKFRYHQLTKQIIAMQGASASTADIV